MWTRRDFLKVSGAAVAVGATAPIPAVLAHTGTQLSRAKDETILVAVQMAGGNDGLNTVVPYEDDHYHRQRPTLALREAEVIKLQDAVGFHPALRPWMELWEGGHLAVVQGVGYPNPSGAHERSMEIWQTARPEDPLGETGWLGRLLDHWFEESLPDHAQGATTRGVFTGRIPVPTTMLGHHRPAVRCQKPEELFAFPAGRDALQNLREGLARASSRLTTSASLLDRVAAAREQAARDLGRLEAVLSSVRHEDFPDTYFGQQLACVTALIRADLGIRIFCVDLGGTEPGSFDTHALQAANHGALLGELASGLAAFGRALQRDRLLERVVVYTYSEFGRTIRENGRKGTDHGSAAPVFVMGGAIHGGLIGKHPPLDQVENGGVKHQVDFRSLYATFLNRWLGVPSQPILGSQFSEVPLFT
ncbi:hypothetical protein THTE_0616 [Thermogutta terrifontis]|uniref:Tat (Twin-arginine translocation) pathway signal sequence domain protein n=1 Tax=Thermogutta terrifontis TaxID=1331910 RepID=A0A286RB81_9BACT|nr:DUF1501 domain-containing protein [Thermogutta terrifontis]ASV73218.1 hypothetical protein THTE_0616 [Thermogutta terrifontis]